MPTTNHTDIYDYFGLFMTSLLILMIIIASLFLLICAVALTMGIILNIRARYRRAREERQDEESQVQLPAYRDEEQPRGLLRERERMLGMVPYEDEPPEYVEVAPVAGIRAVESVAGPADEGSRVVDVANGDMEGRVEIGVGK